MALTSLQANFSYGWCRPESMPPSNVPKMAITIAMRSITTGTKQRETSNAAAFHLNISLRMFCSARGTAADLPAKSNRSPVALKSLSNQRDFASNGAMKLKLPLPATLALTLLCLALSRGEGRAAANTPIDATLFTSYFFDSNRTTLLG